MPHTRLNTPNAVPRRSAGADARDQRRQQALRQPHVQAPQRGAGQHHASGCRRAPARDPRRSAPRSPKRQQSRAVTAIGQRARRIRRRRVDDATSRPSPAAPVAFENPTFCARRTRNASEKRASVSTPAIATTNHVAARQPRGCRPGAARVLSRRSPSARSGSSTPTTISATAQHRRHDRDPERRAEVAREIRHRAEREQRAADRADGVERLAQAEAASARVRRRDVGDQRIARRAANALADAIGEARADDPAQRRRQRKRELGDRREAVAERAPAACACGSVGQRRRRRA